MTDQQEYVDHFRKKIVVPILEISLIHYSPKEYASVVILDWLLSPKSKIKLL